MKGSRKTAILFRDVEYAKKRLSNHVNLRDDKQGRVHAIPSSIATSFKLVCIVNKGTLKRLLGYPLKELAQNPMGEV